MHQPNSVLLKSELDLPAFISGKVRDTYNLGDHLLIVATQAFIFSLVPFPIWGLDNGQEISTVMLATGSCFLLSEYCFLFRHQVFCALSPFLFHEQSPVYD